MAMDRCLVVINLAMVVINLECLASLCQACNLACHQVCSPGCHHKIYNPNWTSAPWCGVLWRLQPLSKDSHWFWWWVTGRQVLFRKFLCYTDVLDPFVFLFPFWKRWIIVPSSSKTWKHWNLVFTLWYIGFEEKIPELNRKSPTLEWLKNCQKSAQHCSFNSQQKQYTIVGWEFRFI